MRWLLAGVAFAVLVALAVGTATLRAENAIRRHLVEQRYTQMRDRLVEQRRLEADLLDSDCARRLAALHAVEVAAELARRQGRLQ